MKNNVYNEMIDVFISYSSADDAQAEAIKARLESPPYNLKCWKANCNNIPVGSFFKEKIVSAIERTKVVLLVLSKSSLASNWVSMEMNVALFENKPIFPIIIDDVTLSSSVEFKLGSSQFYRLNGCDENGFDAAIERIAKDTKKVYNSIIRRTKETLVASLEIKFFPFQFVKAIRNLSGLVCLTSILLFLILGFTSLGGVSVDDPIATRLTVYLWVSLVSFCIFIPFLIWEVTILIKLNPLISVSSPSAFYYKYLIEKSYFLFRKKHIVNALKYLEKSADLGNKRALNAIISLYERGKWVEKSEEIANQYRMKL